MVCATMHRVSIFPCECAHLCKYEDNSGEAKITSATAATRRGGGVLTTGALFHWNKPKGHLGIPSCNESFSECKDVEKGKIQKNPETNMQWLSKYVGVIPSVVSASEIMLWAKNC